jgi:hypothetical protein
MIIEYVKRNVNKIIKSKPKKKGKKLSLTGLNTLFSQDLTLEFPEELGLKPELISNITLPSITAKNYMSSSEIGDLCFDVVIDGKTIVFDTIMENLLTNKFKQFDIFAILKSKDLAIDKRIKYGGCSFIGLNHIPSKKQFGYLKYRVIVNIKNINH